MPRCRCARLPNAEGNAVHVCVCVCVWFRLVCSFISNIHLHKAWLSWLVDCNYSIQFHFYSFLISDITCDCAIMICLAFVCWFYNIEKKVSFLYLFFGWFEQIFEITLSVIQRSLVQFHIVNAIAIEVGELIASSLCARKNLKSVLISSAEQINVNKNIECQIESRCFWI